jgi:hypothetical protein
VSAPAQLDVEPNLERGDVHNDGRFSLVELDLRGGENVTFDHSVEDLQGTDIIAGGRE